MGLKACQATSVAREATGVYGIPLFQLLERRGFAVLLVNARQIKNVSGRKSDVLDGQWIQRLHTYGLLGGSFRPADAYGVVRSYLRYRDELVAARSTQIQHLQKALQQMNVQLTQVLSNIHGVSGQAIMAAILQGERHPLTLAGLVYKRARARRSQVAKARVGDYRAEPLFQLKVASDLDQTYEAKIAAGDAALTAERVQWPDRVPATAQGLEDYERKQRDRKLKHWQSTADALGFQLVEIQKVAITVS